MVNSPDTKMIAISTRNWNNLKNCGRAGESFNDVLDKIFENKTIENKNNVMLLAASSKVATKKETED